MKIYWGNLRNRYRFVGYKKFSPETQEAIRERIKPYINTLDLKSELTQLRKHYKLKNYGEEEIHDNVYVLSAVEKERWLHYKVYVVCCTQHSSIHKCIQRGTLELVSHNNTKQENQYGCMIKEAAEMFKWAVFTSYDVQDLPNF